MGRDVRARGKSSGGLGNRAKSSKMLAHSTNSGVGLFLFSHLDSQRQFHFFELLFCYWTCRLSSIRHFNRRSHRSAAVHRCLSYK